MKKLLSILATLAMLFSLVPISTSAEQTPDNNMPNEIIKEVQPDSKIYSQVTLEDDFTDDSLIVVIKKEYSEVNKVYAPEDFGIPDVESVEDLTAFPDGTDGLEYLNTEEFRQIFKLNLKQSKRSKSNVLSTMRTLEKADFIMSVEPNTIFNAFESLENEPIASMAPAAGAQTAATSAVTPNDPRYSEQYALDTINAPEAWSTSTGSSSVLVGVMDSGIDGNHPDLAGNISTSLGISYTGDNSPYTDNDGHGTHVAGIIGAKGNNGTGVAGVNWNVTLVSIKVASASHVISGIKYSISNNIPIINASLGTDNLSSLFAAINNYKGLFIAACGNSNSNNDERPVYPCSYNLDNIISVGATDSNNERLVEYSDGKIKGSNYGSTTVDLFAPGDDILSTIPSSTYGNMSGTSMAAPYVTGAAALLKAIYPGLGAVQLKEAIMGGVTTHSGLQCVTGGVLNIEGSIEYASTHILYGQKTMLGDINNDGYDDIVSIGVNGTPTAGKVLVGMGNNMQFNMWSWISASHVNPTDEFFLEDVNGDGRADLIVRNPYNDIYIAFAQYDSGTPGGFTGFQFWSLTFSPSSLTNSSILLTGDINGDDKADLAVINPSGSIVVHMKTDTSYSTSSPISVAAVQEAHLADVTGNGNMDIVSRGTNGYLTVIRFNNGFYSWTSPCVVFNPPDKMFLADVNGDGRTDLIARGALSANQGWIYTSLGNTDGSFGPTNGPWGIWNNSSHGQEISSTDALYFADLNGDGRADYISIGLSFIEIRYGNSSGFFTYSSTTRGTINCTMQDTILFGKFTPYNRQDILCIKSGTKSVSVGIVWSGSYYNWVWYSGQGYLIN